MRTDPQRDLDDRFTQFVTAALTGDEATTAALLRQLDLVTACSLMMIGVMNAVSDVEAMAHQAGEDPAVWWQRTLLNADER